MEEPKIVLPANINVLTDFEVLIIRCPFPTSASTMEGAKDNALRFEEWRKDNEK